MKNKIIKEMFLPPFIKSNSKTDGISVCMKKSHKHRGNRKEPVRLLNIARDNLSWLFWNDDGAKTYNQIIDWITAALNEKYERDFPEANSKTLKEWADIDGIEILDPDGFDRSDALLYEKQFTFEEYQKGLIGSTIVPKKYIQKPLDNIPFI